MMIPHKKIVLNKKQIAIYTPSPPILRYMFPVIVQDGITYLCATTTDFSKQKSHSYLNEIIRRVASTSLSQRVQHAGEYELDRDFSNVLSQEMVRSSFKYLR